MEFPKIRVPCFRVLIIRILLFRVLYSYFRKLPYRVRDGRGLDFGGSRLDFGI